ncbi:MAG: hypothetical protein IKJ11_03080 [Clostridia bacterium]|nr:hypothetical protein [Clostridia bacterium]
MRDADVTRTKAAVHAAAILRMNLNITVPAAMIMNTIIMRTDAAMIITAKAVPVDMITAMRR